MAKSTTTLRKAVSPRTAADVLIKCRRRCCLCYFWDGNIDQKPGQIAHIDRDPRNDTLENLAYLCFSHHNFYDSNQRQGKNITPEELRHARNELHKYLNPKLAFIVTIKLDFDGNADPQSVIDELLDLIRDVAHSETVELLNIRRGSLYVTVRMNASQMRSVFAELGSLPFERLGVVDATIDHVEDSVFSPSEGQSVEAIGQIRKRAAVLEFSMMSLLGQVAELEKEAERHNEMLRKLQSLAKRIDVVEHQVEEMVGDLHKSGNPEGFVEELRARKPK